MDFAFHKMSNSSQADETKNEEFAVLEDSNVIELNENASDTAQKMELTVPVDNNEFEEEEENNILEQVEKNQEDLGVFNDSNYVANPNLSAQDELVNYFIDNSDKLNNEIVVNLFLNWLQDNQEG